MRITKQAYHPPQVATISLCDHFAQKDPGQRIIFSGTIDLRDKPDQTAYMGMVNGFRKNVTDPRILGSEVVNWELFNEKNRSFSLAERTCSLHYSLHYLDGQRFDVNLANPCMRAILSDPNNNFYKVVKEHPNFRNISLHLGLGCEMTQTSMIDRHPEPRSPSLGKEEIEKRILTSLIAFRNNLRSAEYKGPILIETLDYHLDMLDGQIATSYDRVTDPDFIQRVLKETGFGLLLDLAHLAITANTRRFTSPTDYLSCFVNADNIHLVQELHLTIPVIKDGIWWDMHRSLTAMQGTPELKAIFDLLEYIITLRKQSTLPLSPLLINFEHAPADWASDVKMLMGFLAAIV